jgi:hypothetical protein
MKSIAQTRKAVSRLSEMKLFHFESPLEVEVRFKRIEGAEQRARFHAGWERVDAYTVRKGGKVSPTSTNPSSQSHIYHPSVQRTPDLPVFELFIATNAFRCIKSE